MAHRSSRRACRRSCQSLLLSAEERATKTSRVFKKCDEEDGKSDRTLGGKAASWAQRGLGVVAAAKTAYDVGKALYSVGQTVAPYTSASLEFV